jgi:type II secretory pathway component GspD/PulD (secretin)
MMGSGVNVRPCSSGRWTATGLVACLIVMGCQSEAGSKRTAGLKGRARPAAAAVSRSDRAAAREDDGETLAPSRVEGRGRLLGAENGAGPEGARGPQGVEGEAQEPADGGPAAAADEPLDAAEERPAAKGPATRSRGAERGAKSPRNAREALADLKETHQFKQTEAEYHQKLGDDAYARLDYATAIEEYRKALDINPALSEARERWLRSSLVLGIRSGEVGAIHREFVEGDRVRKQERLADAHQGLAEGQRLLEDGDFENAEKKFSRIYEELLLFEYPIDITELRQKAKTGLEEAQVKRREAAETHRGSLEKSADEQAQKALQEEARIKEKRVQELVRRAADYIRLKDYDKAIDACNQILELKPDHRVAKFWLKDVKRQQMDQRRMQLYRDQLENNRLREESSEESTVPYTDIFVFPGEEDWNKVRRRKQNLEVVRLEDPDWVRKIKNSLEQKVTFSFEQRPLADVLTFLSDSTGTTIYPDPAINTQELMIDNLAAKDMKAMDALNQVLTLTGLAYTFKENTLYITEKDKAKGTTTFAIYNVSDILNKIRSFQGPELKMQSKEEQTGAGKGASSAVSFSTGGAETEAPIDPTALIELIKEGSGGDAAWGELNSIEPHKGQLLVNATKELHAQIQATLDSLREDADLFVVMEARFIDVRDDFLEDIGVDTRALGVGSNFGTPFANIINNNQTGGNDLGFVDRGNVTTDVKLIKGQKRNAGRIQNIIDGFTGLIAGDRLRGGQARSGGLTLQATWLEPFQLNVILRAVQEKLDARELTAPIVTAHNGQRVYVSVITQRAYIADYELVSGGTGFTIIEVADPVVQTFQEGVILDVEPVITPDKKYVTLDVRPTLAELIGGIISTIHISLGSFTNVAFQVPIGVPQVTLQQSFTSVTVPNGGTVLLGGFKSLKDEKFISYIPIVGKIPWIRNLFRRKAQITEKRSLVILITARIVDLRADERTRYNE